MKKRAAELRAEAKKADGLQALLDSIPQMAPEDPALAERVHTAIVLSQAQGGSFIRSARRTAD